MTTSPHVLYMNTRPLYSCLAVNVLSVYYSKDVRLPVQLQRAMAAEAEAAREARAKVHTRTKPGLRKYVLLQDQS